MIRRLLVLLVLAAAAAAGVTRLYGGLPGSQAAPRSSARVVRIVDGDTIVVRTRAGALERVRYIGVDTPESVKPGTPVQCFAKRAAALNRRLVSGRRVRLVRDAEARDRYGRLLAYVYRRGDGLFVNAELVRRGAARTLTIPPNVEHAAQFRRLAKQARRARRGLWKRC
jgi:micrococcal nuclease